MIDFDWLQWQQKGLISRKSSLCFQMSVVAHGPLVICIYLFLFELSDVSKPKMVSCMIGSLNVFTLLHLYIAAIYNINIV